MENATKALLIAAAMILVVMILSLLVITYEDTSSFFEKEHDNAVVEQLIRFNKQFDNYSGKTIRGNEMLSIINKVIDYNTLLAESNGYGDMTLVIQGFDENVKNILKYNESHTSIFNTININDGMKAISGKVNELLGTAQSAGLTNITETHLQKFSAKIQYILDDTDEEYRDKVIKNILGINLSVNLDDALVVTIQEITKQYYQLTKFKSANFKCTSVKHSTVTAGVEKMVFEIVKDDAGNVIFEW